MMSGNPFKKNNEEGKGDDFLMREITPQEKARFDSIAKEFEGLLSDILRLSNPYSETLQINTDGKFGHHALYVSTPEEFYGNTPIEFYQIATEVEKKHPEYHFTFESDQDGKWIKYTVSKDK